MEALEVLILRFTVHSQTVVFSLEVIGSRKYLYFTVYGTHSQTEYSLRVFSLDEVIGTSKKVIGTSKKVFGCCNPNSIYSSREQSNIIKTKHYFSTIQ